MGWMSVGVERRRALFFLLGSVSSRLEGFGYILFPTTKQIFHILAIPCLQNARYVAKTHP